MATAIQNNRPHHHMGKILKKDKISLLQYAGFPHVGLKMQAEQRGKISQFHTENECSLVVFYVFCQRRTELELSTVFGKGIIEPVFTALLLKDVKGFEKHGDISHYQTTLYLQ